MSNTYLMDLKCIFTNIVNWIKSLSFRTGIIVACICVLFYIISFAQMFLPISIPTKGILWTIFFGLAKATQYTALLIIGKEGVVRIKEYLRKKNKSFLRKNDTE